MFQWLQSFWPKSNHPMAHSPWDQFTFKLIHQIKYNRTPLKISFKDHPESFARAILDSASLRNVFADSTSFAAIASNTLRVALFTSERRATLRFLLSSVVFALFFDDFIFAIDLVLL